MFNKILLNKASLEMKNLKIELDKAAQKQKEYEKEYLSQCAQTKMIIEPNVELTEEFLKHKVENQKGENQKLLKQLIELKKLQAALDNYITEARETIAQLKNEIG